ADSCLLPLGNLLPEAALQCRRASLVCHSSLSVERSRGTDLPLSAHFYPPRAAADEVGGIRLCASHLAYIFQSPGGTLATALIHRQSNRGESESDFPGGPAADPHFYRDRHLALAALGHRHPHQQSAGVWLAYRAAGGALRRPYHRSGARSW